MKQNSFMSIDELPYPHRTTESNTLIGYVTLGHYITNKDRWESKKSLIILLSD